MIADGKNKFMMAGLNHDIIECWKKCYEEFKYQPQKIVTNLHYMPTNQACEAIFDYMIANTYYKLDKEGEQLIKSPARFLQDQCGDCKSYTMFIASCLFCLGIPCKVRFVNFDGGKQYTHVYPVALDSNGREIIMDACELDVDGTPIYDYARPFVKKLDICYG